MKEKKFNLKEWISIDNDPNNKIKCDKNICQFLVNGKEYKVEFEEIYEDLAREKNTRLAH